MIFHSGGLRKAKPMFSSALPIKDVLRGLRSGMTAGRVAIEPIGRGFPAPVRDLVGGLDLIARQIEASTSRLAHSLLDSGAGWQKDGAVPLQALVLRQDRDTLFAQLAYGALGSAYRRFSDRRGLVSETLAARAFNTAVGATAQDQDDLAAELLLRLISVGVLRPAPFDPVNAADPRAERLACIAFTLWLCCARSPGVDDNDLLDLCCDAASYIEGKIALTPANRPALRLALADCARLL